MNKKKDDKLIKLDEKYNTGVKNKVDAEVNALININFITGNQYVRYNKQRQIIEEIHFENSNVYREKGVFNKIKGIRNTVWSKVKDKMPQPQAIPYTQDDEDLDVSKATNAMLDDMFTRQHTTKLLKNVTRDMIDIGPGFIHVGWDSNAGEVVLSDLDALLGDQSEMLSAEQKEELREKLDATGALRSGEVKHEYVPLYDMIVADPFEQDLQEQPWIMRIKSYSKKEACEIWGKDFKEEETIGRLTKQSTRYANDGEILTENLGIHNTERKTDAIIIKEYFSKPSAKHPNGKHIVFSSEFILSEGDLPYVNGEYKSRQYPFIKFGLDTPGLFYSQAFIEDMKEVQKRYNEVRNRKFELITKNVHGQLAVQVGSIPEDQEISNKPGGIIEYNRGFAPPTTLKSSGTGTLDADSEINSLENEFVSIIGVSTISTQGTPQTSAVRGATMVQQLLESDESKFSLLTDTLIDGTVEIAKQSIRLYKQFLMQDEVRFTRFTKDLSTAINWTKDLLVEDIEIKNVAKLSMTNARRKQDIQTLMQSGLLTTENQLGADATMKLIEEMEFGFSLNDIPIKGSADVKKARRENNMIINKLVEIDADDYDDHTIHYDIHANYIKSNEYRKLVIANPQVDQVMRAHIKQHADIVQAQQEKIQAQAIAQQNLKE